MRPLNAYYRRLLYQGLLDDPEMEAHSPEGTTSVTYVVQVKDTRRAEQSVLFATKVTFVNVDENGDKQPVAAHAE